MAYQSVFTALSDPTRREVFERLARAPTSVGRIAAEMPVSRPAISQHLKVLSDAGLVSVRSQGTMRIYAVSPEKLQELRGWLEQMWDTALEAFAKAAEKESRLEN